MAKPRSIHAFNDIAQQLKAARAMGGAEIEFERFGQAVSWRARAYTYRKLLRELEAERLGNPPGIIAVTPYDDMSITLDVPGRATKLQIRFGVVVGKGTMRPLAGATPPPPAGEADLPVEESDDDIIARAAAMLKP